ncbi:tyrosyl-DNA phosphodiesterase-domain-containing protein [Pyrenochaeta sp. MPI-SDFR-AT-0127]|nr:tyrosyl-DNA phosphodiesterase-domain-containing protein [Pyrenochaeta sp. MPI-SDFR-AT-0127]
MPSSDDDEDFKKAIAISLQPGSLGVPQTSASTRSIVDLTSDTEDENEDDNLRRAIELSLSQVNEEHSLGEMTVKRTHVADASVTRISPSKLLAQSTTKGPRATDGSLKSMGFNRKVMEQERLARLGKRKREPSPELLSKQKMRSPAIEAPLKASTLNVPRTAALLQYPSGTIKRTFAVKFPRTDDITIDEVLQADSLNIAVISSFMWDTEWLYKRLDPKLVKQIWLMNARDHETQQRWIREMKETDVPNLRIHFPPMGGMIHSMHSKFMLLFGKDKLRFVVPTANMTQIDWGEVGNDWQPGVMENTVFLIDLPRAADGRVTSKDKLTRFGQELVYFLEQQKVGQNVIDGVLKFDFAQTSDIAFIHSIGGAHKLKSDSATGIPGLARAIQDLQLDNVKDIELDYAASSVGALNDTLLQRLILAASGENFATSSKITNVRDHIRVYFPTDGTVDESIGGPDCGGIISLTRQNYNAPTFPKECLRNYDSTRRGMLSHNKLLFARGRKKDGKLFAWVYVGSANISESAWGGQKVLKSGQMGSLNIRNWECGVVVPVPNDRFDDSRLDAGGVPSMSVFEGTIEIPFRYPGEQYNGRQPWFFRPG